VADSSTRSTHSPRWYPYSRICGRVADWRDAWAATRLGTRARTRRAGTKQSRTPRAGRAVHGAGGTDEFPARPAAG